VVIGGHGPGGTRVTRRGDRRVRRPDGR
jgi:hypothetical protein